MVLRQIGANITRQRSDQPGKTWKAAPRWKRCSHNLIEPLLKLKGREEGVPPKWNSATKWSSWVVDLMALRCLVELGQRGIAACAVVERHREVGRTREEPEPHEPTARKHFQLLALRR